MRAGVFKGVGRPLAIIAIGKDVGRLRNGDRCSQLDSFLPAIAVWKEVNLQFAMTYSLAEFEHVARVLDRGDVEPRAMITDTVALNALPGVFEAMRRRTRQCRAGGSGSRPFRASGRRASGAGPSCRSRLRSPAAR